MLFLYSKYQYCKHFYVRFNVNFFWFAFKHLTFKYIFTLPNLHIFSKSVLIFEEEIQRNCLQKVLNYDFFQRIRFVDWPKFPPTYSQSHIYVYVARAHEMSSWNLFKKFMTAVMLHHWSAQKELFLFLIQGKLIALKYEGRFPAAFDLKYDIENTTL